MNEYISYTTEGCTLAPDGETEVENCQVLGFASGTDVAEAKACLFAAKPWIAELGFDRKLILSRQVV